MNDANECASKWSSKWPSSYVLILGCSEPLCVGWMGKKESERMSLFICVLRHEETEDNFCL